MNYQPKNILVTGGAGFIGSHYVDLLLENAKANVINLDALTYAGKMENIAKANENSRHHFVHGNICDKELIDRLFTQFHIDTVVHFAAESHVDRSITGPELFIETNVLGTQSLLEVARQHWQQRKLSPTECRFHMISTDEVYGSLSDEEPAFTELTRYQPNSPYAASKAAADHIVRAYYHTYKLPITLSNCSNNYGTRQDNEKLIPKVIQACLHQQTIPVYGTGANTRDWIHVIDHCRMVDWVVHHGQLGEGYNLGSQCERKNIDLIRYICKVFDELRPNHAPHDRLISFVTDRAGHDFRYAINPTKANSQGCPKPIYNLEDSLRDMIVKLL